MGLSALSQIPGIQRRLRDGMGIGERHELWLANWEFFKNRPLLGVGWRQNQELSGYYLMDKYQQTHVFSGHAHNNLLDLLGGTGALGTLAWLAWSFWVIRILWMKSTRQTEEEPWFGRGLVCAWVVFHLNGLTQVNFWEGKVQHQMAWVIAWSLFWISPPSSGEA
jgi:O-antigen ligase